jgi:histone deacetylase 11
MDTEPNPEICFRDKARMNIYYHAKYNIDMGLVNKFHPFDGLKFSKIFKVLKEKPEISIIEPKNPISQVVIDEFVGDLLKRLLHSKRYILNALELPFVPIIPFSVIDKKLLLPMRWAVNGTLDSMKEALSGKNCWNLSGGYHHASRDSAEGFCIYNDIGIAYEEHLKSSILKRDDRILIIDVDAHHGNGNAHTFIGNNNVTIVDIFNDDIYPKSSITKNRINISVPLHNNAIGPEYLKSLETALRKIDGSFRIAIVVAGTDVLSSDPLGGFNLTVEDVVNRDIMIFEKLQKMSIPVIFLGGGGYSRESVDATLESISKLYKQ